jgi:mannitol/fructose-specific phosphotransferase system IIA component (Ntr-type)
MTAAVCEAEGLDAQHVEKAVWSREEALSTGLGNGVALPHARIDGLRESLVGVGISRKGIDYDAQDGRPGNVIFLALTPGNDPTAQLQIGSEIARIFRDQTISDRVLHTRNFTDFLALMRIGV